MVNKDYQKSVIKKNVLLYDQLIYHWCWSIVLCQSM